MSTTTSTNLTETQFWKAVFVLIKNQHVVQKKLSGITILELYKIDTNCKIDFKTTNDILVDDEESMAWKTSSDFHKHSINNENICLEIDKIKNEEKYNGILLVSKFIHKDGTVQCQSSMGYQILDFSKIEYHCHSSSHILSNYYIVFKDLDITITLLQSSKKLKLEENWCTHYFKPKFLKWAQNEIDPTKPSTSSLSLIDIEEYTILYNELKTKHAKEIIKIWPESTDPLKFVHEDVAIAAYLICLWKKTKSEPIVNFVDLGCGNGLLVYILNSEGYLGYGIDVRCRKIWNFYPKNVRLIEKTIIPNDTSFDYNADWIIGNHSDELSPWIPVITAISSYNCKYFLLPCCAYEFSGDKYQRRNSNNSTYNDFLEYVNYISGKCEFDILKDRLKIPSTKRIAYIGITRNYSIEQFHNKVHYIKSFLEDEISNTNIKLRSKIEIVQNCTQIDRNIINELVLKIFQLILKSCDPNQTTDWNEGGIVNLQDIAKHLSRDNLKEIKAQCGGLKTLLKNQHEVFEIKGSTVGIRRPILKPVNPTSTKRRSCFFDNYHPNGCPLTTIECSFQHNKN